MIALGGLLGVFTFTAAVGFLVVGGGRPGRRALRGMVRRHAVKRVRAGVGGRTAVARPAVRPSPKAHPASAPRPVPTGQPGSGPTITSTSGVTHKLRSGRQAVCGVVVSHASVKPGRKCRRCF